jgi:hypothetical protein
MDSAARSAWVESAAIAHVPKAAPSPPKCSSVQKKGRPQRIVRQEPQFWMRRQSVQNSRWTWRTSTAVGVSSRKKGRIRRMTQVGRIESSRDTAGGLIDAQGSVFAGVPGRAVAIARTDRAAMPAPPARTQSGIAAAPAKDSRTVAVQRVEYGFNRGPTRVGARFAGNGIFGCGDGAPKIATETH